MLEILRKRKSVRDFSEAGIEPEKVTALLESALLSPSSRNHDPWEFIAVEDRETIKKLAGSKKAGSSFIEKSPLVIAVTGNRDKSDVWIEDCSIATIIIQLTAESLDLGSCWIQIRRRETADGDLSENFVRKVLDIPENHSVLSLVAVGYPAERTARTLKITDFSKCRHDSYSKPYPYKN